MIRFLDLAAQYREIRPEIDRAIETVIADSAYIGGRHVATFEQQFAQVAGAAHCIGVGNGTDALEIAIEALALPPGSEVIVPANSFIASAEAVSRCGHRVVFADVDPATYVIDVATVRARLTPRTRAIVAVHLYGHPCDMEALTAFAREHRLAVIEDCAQAHGALCHGRPVGGWGDVGAFSFYPGKNLGAYGDGGAITTQRDDLARRCRMIANHGRVAKYEHEFEGRNSRLDGLQAAVLSAKLPHLPAWTQRREAVAEVYGHGLQGVGDLVLPVRRAWARPVHHLYVVRTAHRDALRQHLAQQEIETGIHYPTALPKLQAYRHLAAQGDAPFCCAVDGTLLSLPIGEHLSAADAQAVVAAVRGYYATRPEAAPQPELSEAR